MCVRGRENFLHACTEKTAHAAIQTTFSKSHILSSCVRLAPCLRWKEKKLENNIIPLVLWEDGIEEGQASPISEGEPVWEQGAHFPGCLGAALRLSTM